MRYTSIKTENRQCINKNKIDSWLLAFKLTDGISPHTHTNRFDNKIKEFTQREVITWK